MIRPGENRLQLLFHRSQKGIHFGVGPDGDAQVVPNLRTGKPPDQKSPVSEPDMPFLGWVPRWFDQEKIGLTGQDPKPDRGQGGSDPLTGRANPPKVFPVIG